MSLSYFSEAVTMQQNAVVKPVVPDGSTESELDSRSLSNSRSPSPIFSEYEYFISASFIPDFPAEISLHDNPPTPHRSSSHFEEPSDNSSSSRPPSPLYLEFEDLIPSMPSMPNSSYDSLPNSRSSNEGLTTIVMPRVIFDSPSHMNQRQTELTSADDNHPIPKPALRFPVEPDHDASNFRPTSPVRRRKLLAIDTTPSSSTVKRRALPQHPKMSLSYILNPSAPTTAQELTRPELVVPKPVHPLTSILSHSSRSPSPLSPSSTDPGTPSSTFELNSPLHETPPTSPEPVPDSPLSTHRSISPPSSPSSPPFLSGFGRLLPPQFVPDFTFDYLPYSLIYETAGLEQGSGNNLADLGLRSVRVQVPICPPSVDQPSPFNNDSHSRSTSPESTIDLLNTPNPRPGSEITEDEYILASPITTPPSSPLPTTADTFDLVELP